ncbi:peptidoglycan-N-acetylglucosamine deacetylase [Priestia taiwanensis]|uniref:Polysaccharide deacetylase n=1 Tax=Priestia taiwanensis TaxID=1347902 RepID=A0A917ARU5_9BACI|nr:polysaccharide deacetylase family protein [Priestia taiwanensis]MBM7363153.1 peptidoglycan/xylan/chitin deacetylase (PgdA/CDA1 family) [Priestia taiwanensis]GGE68126.1 polysaccharide deacetylase [Priestia taiwanensis]
MYYTYPQDMRYQPTYPYGPPVYAPIPYPQYQTPYPYPTRTPQPTDELRGSWTPFTWVEKYAYAFSGPYNKAEVAITFDDGPDLGFTPQLLQKLKKYNVKATFFLLGQNIEKHPEMVKRIANEGHLLANHSYSHPNYAKLSLEEFKEQINKTNNLIKDLVGYSPRFVRPPYGSITEEQLSWATKKKLMIVQWSVDTLDWKGLSGDEIANKVMGGSFPGSVLLQHSASGVPLQGTVDSLDKFIPAMQKKGVRFVLLTKMFNMSKSP